jgi:hypothetical protein
MKSGQAEILRLTYSIGFGSEGEDSDPANPLSRAANRLLEYGKPFKRLTMCFLHDMDSYRWFGVFVESDKKLIVFFPGPISAVSSIIVYQGNRLQRNKAFNFDHMTLESDFKGWHITSPKSGRHIGRFPSADLGNGKYLWCGFSFCDGSSLRELLKETTITVKLPAPDNNRRLKAFMNSINNAPIHMLEFHPKAREMFPEGFSHVSMIVGPRGFRDYEGQRYAYPENSPFLINPFPIGPLQVPDQRYRIELSDSVDIQINAARLPGVLHGPFTITAVK